MRYDVSSPKKTLHLFLEVEMNLYLYQEILQLSGYSIIVIYLCKIALKPFLYMLIGGYIFHFSSVQYERKEKFLSSQNLSFQIVSSNTQKLLKAM